MALSGLALSSQGAALLFWLQDTLSPAVWRLQVQRITGGGEGGMEHGEVLQVAAF